MKSAWNEIVEVTCPICGAKRLAERRNRGTSRICLSCCITRARKRVKWGTTHGESKTLLYAVWNAMLQRCQNQTCENFPAYGGRGIGVCREWQDYVPFRDWALANGYRRGLLLDRQDNDGNYEPGNCRWATSGVSAHNRSTTKFSVADVAVIKELASLNLASTFIAALFGVDYRQISDIRHGKRFAWVNSFVEM
jgi:hypothetical protein